MIYKEYGKTGKKVSAVGFGGMRFDISKSKEENAEPLRYTNAKGVNYFDTAPYRWDGVMAAHKSGYGVVVMNRLFGGAIPTHEKIAFFFSFRRRNPHRSNFAILNILSTNIGSTKRFYRP